MFNFFKHEKFPTILFVVASLSALVVFAGIFSFSFLSHLFVASQQVAVQPDSIEASTAEITASEDPYLTKVKTLKDTIKAPVISENDPQIGNTSSKITLVQYSDYTCQFCNQQEQIIEKVLGKFAGKIKYIRKDYLAGNSSSLSFQAALGARCAGEQDKYWQYHDGLINTAKLDSNSLNKIAEDIGLSISDFKNCLKDKKYLADIQNNILEADALDISGVPFLYINDKEFLGSVNENEIENEITNTLNK